MACHSVCVPVKVSLTNYSAACQQIYRATGINQNFLWCGSGFTQLPNGLGFGGSQGGPVGHFALYVDNTLDTGMSRPIATFANECLAGSQVFQVGARALKIPPCCILSCPCWLYGHQGGYICRLSKSESLPIREDTYAG